MPIPDYEELKKIQSSIYAPTVFTPGQEKEVFLQEGGVGNLAYIVFNITAAEDEGYEEANIKIFIDDSDDTSPDFVFSVNDFFAFAYPGEEKKSLREETNNIIGALFLNGKKGSFYIKANTDFFRRIRITAQNGSVGNSTIGVSVLYFLRYYKQGG